VKIGDILIIFDYNYWANNRILSAAEQVSPEQYVAPAACSYGSLRGTLLHTLDAEYGWRIICQTGVVAFDMTEADFPTLDVLMQRWREEEQAMRAYLAGLTDDDMLSLVRYTIDTGIKRERVLWHCLWHVVNHGTQHRSEVAAILTACGQSPGDVDFTLFLRETQ
jgi:uncharacterized damage-inducible protein DinB